MKRTGLCFLLCLLLLIPLPARAEEFRDIPYVVDRADLLTDQENIYLNNRAEEISSTYGVDVLIAVVEDMDGEFAGEYAASLNGSRSWWDTDDAVLFLLAMEEREWYIATFGTAISIFSDDMLDSLGYDTAAFFSAGEYYRGFTEYLSGAESCLLYRQSDGFADSYGTYEPDQKTFLSVLPVSLLIGLVVAAISLLVMRSAMNTKRIQHGAGDYMNPGSYHLRTHQDIFLYSNISKTRRQETSSGSRGGSTIHRSSAGRSHGGRGGKF